MEEKIKDLEYRIKSLQQEIAFKDDLLDVNFEILKEIYKYNLKINELIENEYIKEDLLEQL